ncbi:hypothetical protein M9M43_002108 [Escherichia coli]|nr:hypothetical protein [Escherichia coli]EET8268959.1 hypothetical protein [Escherichia coli]EFA1526541.1 hypothetical protein [Escherichia coli]EFG2981067.1 hypothetical protein [Escherichia coli]EFG6327212.1 hypothetical protein [Escherichia coli]
MKNVTGKTALLQALAVGDSAVWMPEGGRVPAREMALFKSVSLKLGIQIRQKAAVLAAPGDIALSVVIVTRIV